MSLHRVLLWLMVAGPMLSPAKGQLPHFTDVTAAAGITWAQSDPGVLLGSGAAFLDYDQDGWPDIFLTGGVADSALYRNLGNGSFADVTAAAGLLGILNAGQWPMGACVGDYDNDGDPDLYLLTWGPNVLCRNEGNGTFSDATAAAGVGDASWSNGAAFGDYDGDGWLDLYVGNYILTPNFPNHVPWPNRLYHNNGDGTFSDVSAVCGVAGAGTTLAVCWSDYDGDSDLDLLVGNDFGATVQPNQLYRNDGPVGGAPGAWGFTEVGAAVGADLGIYCMGIAAADYDHDGDLDYYFSNLGRNVLLRNNGSAGFTDVTTTAGVELTFDPTALSYFATSWGVGFHDFDADGWEDLYVSNGFIPAATFLANGLTTPNVLYHHDGPALTFTDVSLAAAVNHPGIGRGCAFGDFDRDGDLDILQANINGTPVLLRNDSQGSNHWLRVEPEGRLSAREGQGARVKVEAGGRSWTREVNRNYSFESSSELPVHVGLGAAAVIDRLSIRWPSGIEHRLHHLPADVSLVAVEPLVTVDPASTAPPTVVEGQTLNLQLILRNHTPLAQSVVHLLEIRVLGLSLLGAAVPAVVPASSSLSLPLGLYLPPGVTGGADVALEFLWTVADPGLGVDQWTRVVVVTP